MNNISNAELKKEIELLKLEMKSLKTEINVIKRTSKNKGEIK
ncbi:MAG: hypothetical protein RSC84_02530 [Peptostreptococcaceae bacterium]